jgi:hypothetical protein
VLHLLFFTVTSNLSVSPHYQSSYHHLISQLIYESCFISVIEVPADGSRYHWLIDHSLTILQHTPKRTYDNKESDERDARKRSVWFRKLKYECSTENGGYRGSIQTRDLPR